VVVAAKQLQAADGRDRECRVQVHCGTHMVTVEGQSKGLNPVWNKPVVMEVLPDVQAVSFEVLDRLGTATNGGKWLGTLQVPLDELAEVRPALNARTKWTRRVPHPVLIGHAATGGGVRLLVRSAAGERAEGAGFAARAAQLRAGLPSRSTAQGFSSLSVAVCFSSHFIGQGFWSLSVFGNRLFRSPQRIEYIDPAERGIVQKAVGSCEVMIVAARGLGLLAESPKTNPPTPASSAFNSISGSALNSINSINSSAAPFPPAPGGSHMLGPSDGSHPAISPGRVSFANGDAGSISPFTQASSSIALCTLHSALCTLPCSRPGLIASGPDCVRESRLSLLQPSDRCN